MKLRWIIVATSSVALICVGAIAWHFVHAELAERRLAKEAIAYRAGAEQGNAESQFKMGSMYSRGKGVPQDYNEAIRWYRKSAEQGYAKAEYNLSIMYRDGKGVPQDYGESERWCRKAAEQGNARAQLGLGNKYYRGEGVLQDYAEAVRWYRKSAEQGDGNAQYALGFMYYSGYGVAQDIGEANGWFHHAAAQGNEDAMRAVGLKTVWPPISKITLPLKFIASLVFTVIFLKSGRSQQTRAQVVTGVASLLLIFAVVLDLFWYRYIGHLQSSTAFTGLFLVRHLVSGAIIAGLAFIVHPKGPRVVLVAAAAIFLGLTLLGVVRSELRHIPLTIRFLCFIGLPIGMAIPSVIFLRLDCKGRGQELNGKGDAVPPLNTPL